MEQVPTAEQLKEMQQVDPRTVNRSKLVDINSVIIDSELSQIDRMKSFISQIKNPYCYKCGNMVVKLTYSEKNITLGQCLENHFESLV